jgi:ribose 5-phosphate isomerase B
MKVAIACDHAGYEVRKTIVVWLWDEGHNVVDIGPSKNEVVDYPDCARVVAERVTSPGDCERGILICGTGVGMCIAANRTLGVRAFVGSSPEVVKAAREHNDTNIICFGARTQKVKDIIENLRTFFYTDSSTEERHQRRIAKMDR